jgi:hypothetical protein
MKHSSIGLAAAGLALVWTSSGTAGLTGTLVLSGTIAGTASTRVAAGRAPSRSPAGEFVDSSEFEVARIFQRSNLTQGYDLFVSGRNDPGAYRLSLNAQPLTVSQTPVLVHAQNPSDLPSAATYIISAHRSGPLPARERPPSITFTLVAR